MDAKAALQHAKQVADKRRAERLGRKRSCVLCALVESQKVALGAHPDGLGPCCKNVAACLARTQGGR